MNKNTPPNIITANNTTNLMIIGATKTEIKQYINKLKPLTNLQTALIRAMCKLDLTPKELDEILETNQPDLFETTTPSNQ